MSTIAFARLVREELDEDLRLAEAGILQGAESWEQYQYALGRRRGLQQAIAAIDETTRRFDEQN